MDYAIVDPRKEKRYLRKCGFNAMYDAYIQGEFEASRRRPRANPYPAGKRHDAWQHGFSLADPLGDWHGENR